MVKDTGELVELASTRGVEKQLRECVAVENRFAALLPPEDFRNTLKQGFISLSEKPLELSQTAAPMQEFENKTRE